MTFGDDGYRRSFALNGAVQDDERLLSVDEVQLGAGRHAVTLSAGLRTRWHE